jgi:D-alanyl-D-alanine carboxypeptidase
VLNRQVFCIILLIVLTREVDFMRTEFFIKAQLGLISRLLTAILALSCMSTVYAKETAPAKVTKSVATKSTKPAKAVVAKSSQAVKKKPATTANRTTSKPRQVTAAAKKNKPALAKNTHAKPVPYKPQFASIAVDASTGKILAAEDIDGLRHPASLTKVMTLYVLFQDLQARRIFLNTELLVTARAANMAPSKLGLKAGETISVEDAIKALVTKSANDVASTVAENMAGTEAEFAARMTRTAHSIGMTKTVFKSASGLPNKDEWTTARDMATLSLRVQRDFPQYYHYFSTVAFYYKGQVLRTHNKLLTNYEGADGIKTGYIAKSGFNLTTSAKRGNKRVVGVVIGATSTASRNQYMAKMLDENFLKCASGYTIAAIAGRSSTEQFATAKDGQLAVFP